MAQYSTSTNPSKHRWQKPARPADSKTPFDCTGTSKARNGARAHKTSDNPRGKNGMFGSSSFHNAFENGVFYGAKKSKASGTRATSPFSSNGNRKTQGSSPLSALAKIVGGGAIAAVGLPLLILPGPGLLFIGVGAALAVSGLNDLKQVLA